jgi:hypothetical protein
MHRTQPVRVGLVSAFVLTCLVACGGPTWGEVAERFSQPGCKKIKECGDEKKFAAAFPGGVDECARKTVAEMKTARPDDWDARSVCTDEEVDKCIKDFEAMACPPNIDDLKVPCDC